jgi:hypothetical protein
VIKNYLRNTFDKLGVWSRLELALYVAAHGGTQWRGPTPLPLAPLLSIEPAEQSSPPPLPIKNDDHESTGSRNKARGLPRLISA